MFTFTVVDLDQPAAELFSVAPSTSKPGTYDVDMASVHTLPSPILPPAIDFSCYVRILNQSGQPLTLTGSTASQGYWPVPPPQAISAGGRGDAWLQDDVGGIGSAGTFSYQGAGDFSVSCPTGAVKNSVSGAGGNFFARSGASDWGAKGSVPDSAARAEIEHHLLSRSWAIAVGLAQPSEATIAASGSSPRCSAS